MTISSRQRREGCEAYLELVAQWEQEHGRKATPADEVRILEDILASWGVRKRADNMYHADDVGAALKRLGIG